MKKVGLIEKIGSKHRFSYSQVKYDDFGWAEAEVYLPLDYDLVEVKNEENKVNSAWVIGIEWDGYRLKNNTKVTHWRRTDPCCRERLLAKSITNS